MIVIHGFYRLAPRRIAYRNDYCVPCGAERIAVQSRTFDLLHIFWLPVLPLGFWKRWACSVCSRDPHVSVKTRRSFKIAGAVLLALFAVLSWFMPAQGGDDALIAWVFRIGSPIGFVATVVSVLRSGPEPSLRERLEAVIPNTNPACPFCGAALFDLPHWHCPRCNVRRL